MLYFDRWDICAAYNAFAVDYNGDAYTNAIHCRLSRIAYCPARSEETLAGLSENAKEIYAGLVRRHFATLMAAERLHRRANGRAGTIFLGNFRYGVSRDVLACYGA